MQWCRAVLWCFGCVHKMTKTESWNILFLLGPSLPRAFFLSGMTFPSVALICTAMHCSRLQQLWIDQEQPIPYLISSVYVYFCQTLAVVKKTWKYIQQKLKTPRQQCRCLALTQNSIEATLSNSSITNLVLNNLFPNYFIIFSSTLKPKLLDCQRVNHHTNLALITLKR